MDAPRVFAPWSDVYGVVGSVYGAVTASFVWHKRVDERVSHIGFEQLSEDKCCFETQGGKPVCSFTLFMDDILVAWAPGYDINELRHATNIKWAWHTSLPRKR